MTSEKTKGKFWKIFRLIGSENEGESRAAVRNVMRMLTADGKSWNWFCDGIETQTKSVAKRRFPDVPDEVIDKMMKEIFKNE